MKTCSKCKREQELSGFTRNRREADGYNSWCKDCYKEYRRQNRVRIYQNNREWKRRNAERNAEGKRRHYENNREARNAYWRLRKQRMRKAKPSWVLWHEVDEAYQNCPDEKHVDHIVPIQSEIVCGLHVPWNLQYLDPAENISKSNRFWPDMPERPEL